MNQKANVHYTKQELLDTADWIEDGGMYWGHAFSEMPHMIQQDLIAEFETEIQETKHEMEGIKEIDPDYFNKRKEYVQEIEEFRNDRFCPGERGYLLFPMLEVYADTRLSEIRDYCKEAALER